MSQRRPRQKRQKSAEVGSRWTVTASEKPKVTPKPVTTRHRGRSPKVINAVTPRDGVMSRSNTLVKKPKPDETREEATADMLVSGIPINAVAAVEFSKHPFRDADLTECLVKLYDTVDRVQAGDLGEPEALLTAQAVTLNAIFTDLALKAANTEYLDKFDRYLRLALKAQGQCRATIETLAEIKNPPTLFAQQANVAHGPQQVNNTASREGRATKPMRAAKPKNRAKRTIRGL